MGFKAVALDDLRQHWGGLFCAVSVQLYSVPPGAGIPGDGGKCDAFSKARVQSGKRIGRILHEISNSFRFFERQWVIIAASFRSEAGHVRLLEFMSWAVTGLHKLPLWQHYASQTETCLHLLRRGAWLK